MARHIEQTVLATGYSFTRDEISDILETAVRARMQAEARTPMPSGTPFRLSATVSDDMIESVDAVFEVARDRALSSPAP